MNKKYKFVILFTCLFLALIIILFVIYFKFFYQVEFYRYSDDDFKFNYDVNFKVGKNNGIYTLNDKKLVTITIEVLNNTNMSDIDKSLAIILSDERVNTGYNKVSFSCLDHICQSVYQNDEEEITIAVEFIDEDIYVYKLINKIEDSDFYISKFDLVVNSFMRVE